jgi:hypothetical protein
MQPGEERGDAQCPGLRVRCSASGKKVFFYRYRSKHGALREIRLGDVGPLTLAKARDAALKKRVERESPRPSINAPRNGRCRSTIRLNTQWRGPSCCNSFRSPLPIVNPPVASASRRRVWQKSS